MATSTRFCRLFFIALALLFTLVYMIGDAPSPQNYVWGALLGISVGGSVIASDFLLKKITLRSLTTTLLGLFIGYLLAVGVIFIFDAFLSIVHIESTARFIEITKVVIFLLSTYLGVVVTLRASSAVAFSIPFIQFTPTKTKTRAIIADQSALCDPRIIDLAASGLLDGRLIIPRFLISELHSLESSENEGDQERAKRAFEVIRKLEALSTFSLRYQDMHFPELKESKGKVLRLARLLDSDVLSCVIDKVEMAQIEGVRVININALANALKPITSKGELLKIKIQRHGKEDRQGIGYLEDGTMVVVNGGGDFIGMGIDTHVLSVKHTSAGRMIFCNIIEREHA